MSFRLRDPQGSITPQPFPASFDLVPGTNTPRTNLLARFLLTEGTVGQPYGGPWADTSGNGYSATLALGATPNRVTEGLESSDDDGFMIRVSGAKLTGSFTVVATLKHTVDPSETNWVGWWAHGAPSNFPADPANSWPLDLSPYPTMRTEVDATSQDDTHGLHDTGATRFGGGVERVWMDGDATPASELQTMVFKAHSLVTGTLGMVSLRSLKQWNDPKGYCYRKATGLANFFATVTAQDHCFGIFPWGSHRPATGLVSAIYIYNTLVTNDMGLFAARDQAAVVKARGGEAPGGS